MNCEKSMTLNDRAKKVLVGGVNSPVRSFKRVGKSPILVKSARGACIVDVDGNEYLDLVMSYGPHLFGHAHPLIVHAVQDAMKNSSCYGMTSEKEIVWAERLLSKFPYFSKVRAMSSGTEACATAVRLARGYTEKDKVLKFSGHYHGHVDSLMVAAGSGLATLDENETVPDSAGIPNALSSLALVSEFNNIELLDKVFEVNASEMSCVILEAIMGNMGVIRPDLAFLKHLRALCDQHKVLLIFDEVMTGFRVHESSAQGLYEIQPDLATFGKIVGGGMPLAALAGKEKIMCHLAPLGHVYQAGTLSGNPVCIEAGLAMMDLIKQNDPYSRLEEFGSKFEAVITEEISRNKVPFCVNRVGSMISVFARSEEPKNDADAMDVNHELFNKYFWAMLEEGFMLPPSPYEAYFLSIPLSEIPEDEWKLKIKNVFESLKDV